MNLSTTLILNGPYGTIQSAKTPQNTTTRTRTKPSRPNGSLRRRRSRRAPEIVAADVAVVRTAISESCADTGIEPGDNEIGDQGAEGEQGNGRKHGALDHRVVANVRRVDDELADA